MTSIPILGNSLVALLIFLTGAGLGRFLFRKLVIPSFDTLEDSCLKLTLGVGLLQFVPFLLFSTGFGSPAIVRNVFLLLTLILSPEIWRFLREGIQGTLASYKKDSIRHWPILAASCSVALLLFLHFLLANRPVTDPDGLHYHLTAPMKYLEAGRFFYLPTFLHTNWPLGIEMLFGIQMAFLPHGAVSLLHFGLGLLLHLEVFTLGRRVANPAVGTLASLSLMIWTLPLMTYAYIDLGLMLFICAGFHAFWLGAMGNESSIVHSDRTEEFETSRCWWVLAALFAGLSATAKLNGVFNLLLIGGMVSYSDLLPTGWQNGRSVFHWQRAVKTAAWFFPVAFAFPLPWYLKSYVLTGTPIYPYFSTVLGVRDWDAAAQARMTVYFQELNSFRGSPKLMRYVKPARIAVSIGTVGSGYLMSKWRALEPVRSLVFFAMASAFIQVATSGIYLRLMLPLFPLFLILGYYLVSQSIKLTRFRMEWLILPVSLLVWGTPKHALQVVTNVRGSIRVVTGQESKDSYLLRTVPVYPVCQWINQNLPVDSVVIMGNMWDPYAALIHCRSLSTSRWVQNALRFESDALFIADAKRLGATHLLMQDDDIVDNYPQIYREDRDRILYEQPLLRRIRDRYGVLVYRHKGYQLYRINLP